jgi:hypothetical protein
VNAVKRADRTTSPTNKTVWHARRKPSGEQGDLIVIGHHAEAALIATASLFCGRRAKVHMLDCVSIVLLSDDDVRIARIPSASVASYPVD